MNKILIRRLGATYSLEFRLFYSAILTWDAVILFPGRYVIISAVDPVHINTYGERNFSAQCSPISERAL